MSDEKKMPKVEDKQPCAVCGEMVTVNPAGRAAHMRGHKTNEVIVTDASEKATAKARGLSEEEKSILDRALAAQENFRKAPEVFMSEDSSDENEALVRLYAPHCLDVYDPSGKLVKKGKGHPFFARKDKLIHWASSGYVPVEAGNGFVTNSGGDVLCVCDRDLHEARERKQQNESRGIVRSSAKDLNAGRADGLEKGDSRDIRGESLKVGEETIQV
jgi:hypothetical protein